jgi:exodeoxyribonuclease-5
MTDKIPNENQSAAIAAFKAFMADPEQRLFALLGYAGTGKSFTTAALLRGLQARPPATDADDEDGGLTRFRDLARGASMREKVIATPTHKATGVLRRFLDGENIPYESGYDAYRHQMGTPITGTTAALLGIRPLIVEDQTADKQTFGDAGSGGMLAKLGGRLGLVAIDEVSMLSAPQLELISRQAEAVGAKVLVIGDPGQLPPVNAPAIQWDALQNVAVLEQIMRQSGESAIPHLAAAIRTGGNWQAVEGPGVDHFHNPAGAFIDELNGPPDLDETKRSVFIAYRNAVVNGVQEAACRKVYGHGRAEFAAGEVVVANRPLYIGMGGRKVAVVQNGDTVAVVEVVGQGEYGRVARFRHVDGRTFTAEFLAEQDANDPHHPFNVAVRERARIASGLQSDWAKNKHDSALDAQRKAAWASYFELRDGTLVGLSHLFAITSHKSQGSSYGVAFVDASDLAALGRNGLYVAATRPREELIIG